jgi:hypothetical protein
MFNPWDRASETAIGAGKNAEKTKNRWIRLDHLY